MRASVAILVIPLSMLSLIDMVIGCCYCGGTEEISCLSQGSGGPIDWVTQGICGNCNGYPETRGYCCMLLPYCAGDSRCPYSLEEIKTWKAKPLDQRRTPVPVPDSKSPTSSPTPQAMIAVLISDHEGHACFIGDDESYHPAVQDAGKLNNVIFCQVVMKDNVTPVTKRPARFFLHGAGADFTGNGVQISTGGKYCRLAYHNRNGVADGRFRILCDLANDKYAENFNVASLGNGQFSIQDSTGSYCEMGWGIRCRFRTQVTDWGHFNIQKYSEQPPVSTAPTTSPSEAPTTSPSEAPTTSQEQTLPYTFGDYGAYCSTSKTGGAFEEPPYSELGNYPLMYCLIDAKLQGYNFVHYWAETGLCRGLHTCPYEYNCGTRECLEFDEGVRTYSMTNYDPLPYAFGNHISRCVSSEVQDTSKIEIPETHSLGNGFTLKDCLRAAKNEGYKFIQFWASDGSCEGLCDCPYEYSFEEEKGVQIYNLELIPVTPDGSAPTYMRWVSFANKGSFADESDITDTSEFNELWATSPNKIIYRHCTDCVPSHRHIYYRRFDDFGLPETMDLIDLVKNSWTTSNSNRFGEEFALYSSYDDAVAHRNQWIFCNFNEEGVGFPRDCGPDGRVDDNWNSFVGAGGKVNVGFYVETEHPADYDKWKPDISLLSSAQSLITQCPTSAPRPPDIFDDFSSTSQPVSSAASFLGSPVTILSVSFLLHLIITIVAQIG